jgi:hypothetical protein
MTETLRSFVSATPNDRIGRGLDIATDVAADRDASQRFVSTAPDLRSSPETAVHTGEKTAAVPPRPVAAL